MRTRLGCIVIGFLFFHLFVSAQTAIIDTGTPSGDPAEVSTAPAPSSALAISGGGTKNYIPQWLSSSKLGNSLIFQTGGKLGIGTTSPEASLDVNGAVNASTSFNLTGLAFAFGSFSNGNAFLGFAGNSTMTGINNAACGVSALVSNTSGSAGTAIGEAALAFNNTGSFNTASGFQALFSNTTGGSNTADGVAALVTNTTGGGNTASGGGALYSNTTGMQNTASGQGALYQNVTGNNNTALGYNSGPDSASPNLTNATAIGANATVSESNALVLGGTGTNAVKVGIGTATPSNVFTIAQSAGDAISDGWKTYSSRRFKTNIQTLHGALAKIEELRGVSYDAKANGRHEVGLIAEEVGAVVPEVVTWDKNGKDAQSVDYSRLTAVLIEATKEQQTLIRSQQEQIDRLTTQLEAIKASLRTSGGTRGSVRRAKITSRTSTKPL